MRRLQADLVGKPFVGPTLLGQDNQSAIALAKNEVGGGKTRHIGLRYHFVKDAVRNGVIQPLYVPADILTKGLGGVLHQAHVKGLGMRTFGD